jgi:hypothetical protein
MRVRRLGGFSAAATLLLRCCQLILAALRSTLRTENARLQVCCLRWVGSSGSS